jgi:hypothetical protein
MIKKSIFLLLVICLVPIYSLSWAVCEKSNLKGTWHIYGIGGDGKGDFGVYRGTVKIKADGSVVPGTTLTSNEGDKYKVTGGSFKISSNCKVTGTLKQSGSGSKWTDKMFGTMERHKNSFSGMWYAIDDYKECGRFTMIKQ